MIQSSSVTARSSASAGAALRLRPSGRRRRGVTCRRCTSRACPRRPAARRADVDRLAAEILRSGERELDEAVMHPDLPRNLAAGREHPDRVALLDRLHVVGLHPRGPERVAARSPGCCSDRPSRWARSLTQPFAPGPTGGQREYDARRAPASENDPSPRDVNRPRAACQGSLIENDGTGRDRWSPPEQLPCGYTALRLGA